MWPMLNLEPIPSCYHCPRPAAGNAGLGWALTCGAPECLAREGVLVLGATYLGTNGERRTVVALSAPNSKEVVYTRNRGAARYKVRKSTFISWMNKP